MVPILALSTMIGSSALPFQRVLAGMISSGPCCSANMRVTSRFIVLRYAAEIRLKPLSTVAVPGFLISPRLPIWR